VLQWDWECPVMELETSVFVIPKQFVTNIEDRLIVLNDVARSVIDKQRGGHATRVFTYKEKPVTKMLDSAWRTARKRAAELTHLIAAADKVCESDSRKSPAMTLIRSRGRLATA